MNLSRWSVFAALMLVMVIAAIVGPYPVAMPTSGHANAVNRGVQTTLPSSARDAQFNCFLEHFTNQAKESAEPIATL